jgi:hypothetical protein
LKPSKRDRGSRGEAGARCRIDDEAQGKPVPALWEHELYGRVIE